LSRQVLRESKGPVGLPHEQLDPKVDGKRRKLTLSEIWQFVRFCFVGSLNAVIDFVVLDLLLWLYPTNDTAKVLIFNSVAVLLAATNSFFWNKYWTFRNRQRISMAEVGRFVVVAGATALLNDALMLLLTMLFPQVMNSSLIGANLLKLGAIAGTTSVSFFGMRLWVFWQKRHIAVPAPMPIAEVAREGCEEDERAEART
jgi:putative flippase GtrA